MEAASQSRPVTSPAWTGSASGLSVGTLRSWALWKPFSALSFGACHPSARPLNVGDCRGGPGGRVHGLLGPPCVSRWLQGVRCWLKVSVLREPGVCPRPPGLVPGEADPVGAPLLLRMGAGPVPRVSHRPYQHRRRQIHLGQRVCWFSGLWLPHGRGWGGRLPLGTETSRRWPPSWGGEEALWHSVHRRGLSA